MYYILNETNQIIAADDDLLSLCGVTHIDQLTSDIIKGDTVFDFVSDESILIRIEGTRETFTLSRTALSSLVGKITLITLSEEKKADVPSPIDIIGSKEDFLEELEISKNDEEINLISDDTFNNHFSLDDDIISLKEETKEVDNQESFNLALSDAEDENVAFNLDNNDAVLPKEDHTNASEININLEEISQKIGISTSDYNAFLNDFIDTALGLEKNLQSDDDNTRLDAIGTLSHLGEVLHLPLMGNILIDIAQADNADAREKIELFYSTLSRITTTSTSEEAAEDNLDIIEDLPQKTIVSEDMEETPLELFDDSATTNEPIIKEEVKPHASSDEKSFGTISLEGVKPKHFDFQLEEAANDLSLPVELIEEFVHDFINQVHIETKKMLEAYKKGDLDTIQKIGHLLKGASSNLRIIPLSETLYKIQFCKDTSNLETLIKDYWAHFLSFETQINVITS